MKELFCFTSEIKTSGSYNNSFLKKQTFIYHKCPKIAKCFINTSNNYVSKIEASKKIIMEQFKFNPDIIEWMMNVGNTFLLDDLFYGQIFKKNPDQKIYVWKAHVKLLKKYPNLILE